MKSKDDPILDAQAICQESPVTEEELTKKLVDLGWSPVMVPSAIRMATGIYIVKGEDGKFTPRNGNTAEIVRKVLG